MAQTRRRTHAHISPHPPTPQHNHTHTKQSPRTWNLNPVKAGLATTPFHTSSHVLLAPLLAPASCSSSSSSSSSYKGEGIMAVVGIHTCVNPRKYRKSRLKTGQCKAMHTQCARTLSASASVSSRCWSHLIRRSMSLMYLFWVFRVWFCVCIVCKYWV